MYRARIMRTMRTSEKGVQLNPVARTKGIVGCLMLDVGCNRVLRQDAMR